MPNTLTIRGGIGDMLKSVYDTDKDNIVDDSQKLEASTKAQVQDHTPKTHTHTESQISDLVHDAQKVKGVIIDDTAKADQKVLAYDQASNNIVYITKPGGIAIDAIQHLSLSIPSGQLSSQLTIDEVDLSSTFILYSNRDIEDSAATVSMARIQLIDSTHIEATRNTANALLVTNFCLVKTTSGIKSIQRGTITLTAEVQHSITISQVNLAKTFVSYLGAQSTAIYYEQSLARIYLSNSTTLTAHTTAAFAIIIISYEVVEFE